MSYLSRSRIETVPTSPLRVFRSLSTFLASHYSKLWACVRVAARLQAWRVRATCIGAPKPGGQAGRHPLAAAPALFGAEGRFWSVCGAYRQVPQNRFVRKMLPASFSAERPAVANTRYGVGCTCDRFSHVSRHG